ncbi:MAG: PKD domain-containing protein [Bacteroidales bacterium]|nr:PKD domain-containing protein [Bacteroidales bacterium]
MKKFSLLTVMLLFAIVSFSQKITRGSEIGEIYYMGPSATVLSEAIYHSSDFGETAVCRDSISQSTHDIISITADKENGGLYYVTLGEALYYSANYGQQGSWAFKHSNINKSINSGRNIGEVYKSFISHSDNFGGNFVSHLCNGYFGTLKDVDIDVAENIGYCISKKYNVNDTLYFFNTYNNFDDLQVAKKFNFNGTDFIDVSRESNEGNVFLCNQNTNQIFFSSNYGIDWELKNTLTCPRLPINSITGGRQDGELYMLVIYIQCPTKNSEDDHNKHIYIYHSLDYGETFTVYHPFSCGEPANYANFEASPLSGNAPLTVQFDDLSVGAESWEWDFQNDGIIDSYEQNPVYTYEEEGNYTPQLAINNISSTEYIAYRADYITVLSGNSQEIELNSGYQFISSNRSPENPDMLVVLSEMLNDNLGFVRNSQGQMLQNIGGNWVNNIGDWISTEGYLFKMNEADVLSIAGTVINPQTPIELNTGYQFISYLQTESMDALIAFASILNDDLDFIRNSNGETIRKIGSVWVNGIGDCSPGEGFLIKMNGEGVLVYPGSVDADLH